MSARARAARLAAPAVAVGVLVTAWSAFGSRLMHGPRDDLDGHAREYVRLAEALDVHAPGTIEWRIGAAISSSASTPRSTIAARASRLAAHLRDRHDDRTDAARRRHLIAETEALAELSEPFASGEEAWARETRSVERADAGTPTEALRLELASLLPGTGSLADRLAAFEEHFVIPPARVPAVMSRAVARCREETAQHIDLPAGESLTIDYVRRRPWLGYARYLGGFRTAMEVNLDFPLTIDRAITLACHEGYPGHHTSNAVREQRFVRERGWPEFALMPARSPGSSQAEAFATFAGSVALTEPARVALARDVLVPLAGLPPDGTERHIRVARLVERLDVAIADVSGKYLEGFIDRREAARRLEDEALMAHSEATLDFIERYGAYALAYTAGRALFERRAHGSGQVWPFMAAAMLDPEFDP